MINDSLTLNEVLSDTCYYTLCGLAYLGVGSKIDTAKKGYKFHRLGIVEMERKWHFWLRIGLKN